MSNKQKLGIFISLLALLVVYWFARVIYYLPRYYLEKEHQSSSKSESIKDKFYVGSYTPNKRTIKLLDSSIVEIPDAWVEHRWGYNLSWFFTESKEIRNGYNFFIPASLEKVLSNDSIRGWSLPYSLELDKRCTKYTRYPGIGYSANESDSTGFRVFLDLLPDTIHFVVEEKKNLDDGWLNAIVTDSLTFFKTF